MKRTAAIVFLLSLGGPSLVREIPQTGRVETAACAESQHDEAGTNVVAVGDASLPPPPAGGSTTADAQADSAISVEASAPTSGCGASTCGPSAVCCAHALGGGKTGTACAADCAEGDSVLCDLHARCNDGDCGLSIKFPGLLVCE